MTRKLGLMIVLGYAVLGLAACGDSRPPDSSGPPDNPPQEVGALTVQIVTVSGTPIPEFRVGLNTRLDYREAITDADGRVRFTEVPTGTVSVDVGGSGFHWAYRELVVNEDETTDLTMAVVRSIEATPVVIATKARPSDNGRRLTVDVDLAILGEDGLAIPTFTAADFQVFGSDCGFGLCVMDESGMPLMNGSYGAEVDPGVFSWHESPAAPSTGSAIAILLEHSAILAGSDGASLRTASVHGFLDSVTAPDSVAVASYRGTLESPILTTYGTFTSDGSLFHDDVDALAALDASRNPLYPALADMLSWSAMQTTVIEPKTIVLASSWGGWPDDNCGNSWACRHEQRVAVAESSRTLGIPIVTIGGNDPAADIATRSGGSSILIQDPTQYAIAFEALKPIVSRELGFNRVRFVLSSFSNVFDTGHTVWTSGRVHVAPDVWVSIPFMIPIP